MLAGSQSPNSTRIRMRFTNIKLGAENRRTHLSIKKCVHREMSADSIERPFSFASYSCVLLTSAVITSLRLLTSLELNNKDTNLARPRVFYRVRRKRLQPLGTRGERRISGLAAIERDLAMLVPAYEMAEGLNVSNPAPPMRVQRYDLSRWNVCMHDAHALVFE